MMRHLLLRENGPAEPTELTAGQAEALTSLELAVLTRSAAGDWLVGAGSKVGTVRLGDLQVTVQPKLPIDRLIFLMGYARDPAYWRDASVVLDTDSDLPEALAHSFRRLAARALEQGVLQGYRTVDESLPVLRGRVRVADQIARRQGVSLPLEVTYDEFTVDIAENQILLAACVRLLRLPGLPPRLRQGLQRLRLTLADVTPPPPHIPLPPWIPSRLNVRYHAPLRLAELILSADSLEQRSGDLEVSGFVVNMWKIFEDFVSVALSEALAPYGGTASVQHQMHLDQAQRVKLRPDLVWSEPGGGRIVVDAKYKAEKPAGFPQADLYQLLAYCTVLELSEGHLVYAKGNEDELTHRVIGSPVRIHCHTVDLNQPPPDVLRHIETLATRLAGPTGEDEEADSADASRPHAIEMSAFPRHLWHGGPRG